MEEGILDEVVESEEVISADADAPLLMSLRRFVSTMRLALL